MFYRYVSSFAVFGLGLDIVWGSVIKSKCALVLGNSCTAGVTGEDCPQITNETDCNAKTWHPVFNPEKNVMEYIKFGSGIYCGLYEEDSVPVIPIKLCVKDNSDVCMQKGTKITCGYKFENPCCWVKANPDDPGKCTADSNFFSSIMFDLNNDPIPCGILYCGPRIGDNP